MNQSNNYIHHCEYTFVFCTCYRYPLLDKEGIKEALYQKIIDMQEEGQFELLDFKTWPDAVYLKVQCIPDVSPLALMKHIKQQTATEIKKRYPAIKNAVPTIWPRKGILSTKPIPEEEIEQFRNNQNRRIRKK